MKNDYNTNLWKAVLNELKITVPQRLYDLWFTNTEIVSFSENLLSIQVQNEIIKQKIQEKYLAELKNAVFKLSGSQPEIEFIIPKKQEQQALFDFEEQETLYQEKISQESQPAVATKTPPLNLNDMYRFSNFVVGPSNQLAHAACLAVAKTPGKAYNPLFMYGAVGLGKTHLLQAICHELLSGGYEYPIVYLSCEDFINEFITAVEQGDINGFRYKYRHVSLLLIDDVHFLASKERTQEEFFHTFNTLYNANKQIILTSDSPPSEIPELKERLVSRFKWGLVSQISIPVFETRVAIVKKKSKLKERELPDNVCQYISEHIISNIRELEGAVNHLLAMADLHGKEITLDFSKRALREIISFHEPEFHLDEIMETTAKQLNIKVSELKSKKRHKSIVIPRQIGMYMAKKLTNYSLQEIGSFFGGRDHTTVLHAVEKIKDLKNNSPQIADELEKLEKKLLEKKL